MTHPNKQLFDTAEVSPLDHGILFHQRIAPNDSGVLDKEVVFAPGDEDSTPLCMNDMAKPPSPKPTNGDAFPCGPIIGGHSNGRPCYWTRQNGKWEKGRITGEGIPSNAAVICMQDNGAMWIAEKNNEEQEGAPPYLEPKLWTEGKLKAVSELMGSSGASLVAKKVTTKGLVAAVVGTTIKILLPVDLAIDTNRDGKISGGEHASQDKPFRFWINTDHEGSSPGDQGQPDGKILHEADLKNFALLGLNIDKIAGLVENGTIQIGLKNTSGAGAINVYRCPEAVKTAADYLGDQTIANSCVNVNSWGKKADLSKGTVAWLPSDAFSGGVSRDFLLFEGSRVGDVKVTLVVKIGDQETETASVWMKIMHVGEMFQREHAIYNGGHEPEDVPDPWDNPNPLRMASAPDTTYQFQKDPDETKQCLIHVHGWNNTDDEARDRSAQAFKRLWQLGYKGRFVSFRWPTDSGTLGVLTYNYSVYRAWLSGPALASFVNRLPFTPNNRFVFTHSLGSGVIGSALRANPAIQISSCVMAHASMEAMAFDGVTIHWSNYSTPDTDLDAGTRNTFGLADKLNINSCRMINFALPTDSALGTAWETNNDGFKPQPTTFTSQRRWQYEALASPGSKLRYLSLFDAVHYRSVTRLEEAWAYVTKSRSKPLGAVPTTEGCIDETVNLTDADYNFGTDHAAEWELPIQRTYKYWKKLARTFELKISNTP